MQLLFYKLAQDQEVATVLCSISWITCVPAVVTAQDKFVSCMLSRALSYHKMLFSFAFPKDLVFMARSLHPCFSQAAVS